MSTTASPATSTPPTPLDAALEAICASDAFRASPQQQRFLRHLVARLRAGNMAALREMSLGVELFRRSPDQFDPKKDPIVRVEARRLRERLSRYYASDGADATLEISVPLGSYIPVVRERVSAGAVPRVSAEIAAMAQRGWYLMRIRSIEGYRMAVELFTRASDECPTLADAHRGHAWARICIAGHEGVPPEAGGQRAAIRSAIDVARALEPTAPNLFLLDGAFAARFDHDFEASERLHDAGAIGPAHNNAFRGSLGWLYTLTRRFDQAREVFQAAQALDPFGFWHRHNLASLAYFRRDYATAGSAIRDALEIEPTHAMVRLLHMRVLLQCGEAAAALREAEWCIDALPGMTGPEHYRVAALAAVGRRDDARDAMQRLDGDGRYTSPVYRAMALTALGDRDAALDALRTAATERDYWLPTAAIDPAFDALRGDPAFESLIEFVRPSSSGPRSR